MILLVVTREAWGSSGWQLNVINCFLSLDPLLDISQFHYNAFDFFQCPHNRHPTTRLWGDIGLFCCELKIWFMSSCCHCITVTSWCVMLCYIGTQLYCPTGISIINNHFWVTANKSFQDLDFPRLIWFTTRYFCEDWNYIHPSFIIIFHGDVVQLVPYYEAGKYINHLLRTLRLWPECCEKQKKLQSFLAQDISSCKKRGYFIHWLIFVIFCIKIYAPVILY